MYLSGGWGVSKGSPTLTIQRLLSTTLERLPEPDVDHAAVLTEEGTRSCLERLRIEQVTIIHPHRAEWRINPQTETDGVAPGHTQITILSRAAVAPEHVTGTPEDIAQVI